MERQLRSEEGNRNRSYSAYLGRYLQRDPNEAALPILSARAVNGQMLRAVLGRFDPPGHCGDGMNLYGCLGWNWLNGPVDWPGLAPAVVYDNQGPVLRGTSMGKAERAVKPKAEDERAHRSAPSSTPQAALQTCGLAVYDTRSDDDGDVWSPEWGALIIPAGWDFLPRGDAFVTRQVKQGPHWVLAATVMGSDERVVRASRPRTNDGGFGVRDVGSGLSLSRFIAMPDVGFSVRGSGWGASASRR